MKQIISSVALASFLFCLPAGAQEAAKQWFVGGMYPVCYRKQYRSETKGTGTEKPRSGLTHQ